MEITALCASSHVRSRERLLVLQTRRDGKDYESLSGVTHVLNNAESVLQRNDVKDAIDGYEELFAGARVKVRRSSVYTTVPKGVLSAPMPQPRALSELQLPFFAARAFRGANT